MAMASMLATLEEKILLLEWRYFLAAIASTVLLYGIFIIVGGASEYAWVIPFLAGGLFLAHCFFLAYWHFKESHRARAYPLRKSPDSPKGRRMGYSPLLPFTRNGSGSSFFKLRLSVLVQATFLYMFFSANFAWGLATLYGQFIK